MSRYLIPRHRGEMTPAARAMIAERNHAVTSERAEALKAEWIAIKARWDAEVAECERLGLRDG